MSRAAQRERIIVRGNAGRFNLLWTVGLALAVVGGALFAFSLFSGQSERAWHLFHVNWVYFTGLTGGSMALVAANKLANAKWSGVIVRFSAAHVFFSVVSLIGLILIFTVGYHSIYGHMYEQLHSLPHAKAVWLSKPFMFGRLLVGLTALFWVGWKMIRADMVGDMFLARNTVGADRKARYEAATQGFDGSEAAIAEQRASTNRFAAIYVVLYALVFTMIGFDGIQALQPHWFSNLLGGWYFMGSFLGAHTVLALLMQHSRRHLGLADLVTPKQRHDLGKMIFGFTIFWAYLMWSQFLVIWYGNIPEETGFVFQRLWGEWMPVARIVFIGMFLLPFWGLLFIAAKKSPLVLGLFALVSVVSLWIERYLLVLPSITAGSGPLFGLPELGPTLLLLGLFLFCYALFGRTYPMVSPRLAEIAADYEALHGGHGADHGHEDTGLEHPKGAHA